VKKVILLAVAAIALAFGVHAVYFRAATHESRCLIGDKEGEMEWLRGEFHLSDDQYSKIKALHEAFEPRCMEHCRNIAAANATLSKLMAASPEPTPEIAQALETCERVKAECRKATLEQIYAVSRVMNSDEAARYRTMMASFLIEHSFPMNAQQTRGQ